MTQNQIATISGLFMQGNNSVKVSDVKKALNLKDKVADVADMLKAELKTDVRFSVVKKGNTWTLFFVPEIKNSVIAMIEKYQAISEYAMKDSDVARFFCNVINAKNRDEVAVAKDWKGRVVEELSGEGKIKLEFGFTGTCWSIVKAEPVVQPVTIESDEVAQEQEVEQRVDFDTLFWNTFKEGMTPAELHALLDERMTVEGANYYIDDPRFRHIDGRLYTMDYAFPDELKDAVRVARVRNVGATAYAVQQHLPKRYNYLTAEKVRRNLDTCSDIVKLDNGNYDVKADIQVEPVTQLVLEPGS